MAIAKVLFGCAAFLAVALPAYAVEASVLIKLDAGVYSLSTTDGGAPDALVTVKVKGGIASVKITGAEKASFSMKDISQPAGYLGSLTGPYGIAPYFETVSGGGAGLPPNQKDNLLAPQGGDAGAPLKSASWDHTQFDYVTFYESASGGGLTIGSTPSAANVNLVDLYQTGFGGGQVFSITAVPEPSAWAMVILGVGAIGASIRARRGRVADPVAA